MEAIRNIIRIFISIFTLPLVAWWGGRRLHKKIKRNIKEQDPNMNPFDERFEYLRKKAKGAAKRFGIIVKVDGLDNIPKGGCWIVPNHTSNLDAIYVSVAIGGKLPVIPVARDTFTKNRGLKNIGEVGAYRYIKSVDGIFVNRESPRQAVEVMNSAAMYAKNNNRGIVLFPEGTRSITGKLLDFKNGSFKFPQKYFLPILPVTILGTLQAKKFFSLRRREVKVIIHPVIKAIDHSKKPTDVISKKIKKIMQKDLDDYNDSLNEKQLNELNKCKEKARLKIQKREKKLRKKGSKNG